MGPTALGALVRRKRRKLFPKLGLLTAEVGMAKVRVVVPLPRARLEAICSAGLSKTPLPLKSIQALRKPPLGAETSTRPVPPSGPVAPAAGAVESRDGSAAPRSS